MHVFIYTNGAIKPMSNRKADYIYMHTSREHMANVWDAYGVAKTHLVP